MTASTACLDASDDGILAFDLDRSGAIHGGKEIVSPRFAGGNCITDMTSTVSDARAASFRCTCGVIKTAITAIAATRVAAIFIVRRVASPYGIVQRFDRIQFEHLIDGGGPAPWQHLINETELEESGAHSKERAAHIRTRAVSTDAD